MTLFFPDLNVWLALSDTGHVHSASAWKWREILPDDHKLIFSRYTQIGLLRLLTNVSVMGDQTLTLRKAWGVYDRWLEDPRVELYPEPRNLDTGFRQTTEAFAARQAPKAVGDCFHWPMRGNCRRRWSPSTARCMNLRASRVTPQ